MKKQKKKHEKYTKVRSKLPVCFSKQFLGFVLHFELFAYVKERTIDPTQHVDEVLSIGGSTNKHKNKKEQSLRDDGTKEQTT